MSISEYLSENYDRCLIIGNKICLTVRDLVLLEKSRIVEVAEVINTWVTGGECPENWGVVKIGLFIYHPNE